MSLNQFQNSRNSHNFEAPEAEHGCYEEMDYKTTSQLISDLWRSSPYAKVGMAVLVIIAFGYLFSVCAHLAVP